MLPAAALLLSGGVATVDKTHTADAFIKATSDRSQLTDSLLKKQTDRVHTTDANLKAALDEIHTTNALLKATSDRTQIADALLKATLDRAHSTDSLLVADGSPEPPYTGHTSRRFVSTLLDTWTRVRGTVRKSDSNTGNATNKSLYPAIKKRLIDGTEPADENAEWVLIEAIVNLSAAGTFVWTDGTNPVGMVHAVPANVDTPIHGPVKIGKGKALCYTTTGTAPNIQLEAWASELHHMPAKPAGASGA